MVYYQNYPSSENIYSVDIYGSDEPIVGPVYGTMSGSAHEGGGGYAIDLSNGTQVYVDSWRQLEVQCLRQILRRRFLHGLLPELSQL